MQTDGLEPGAEFRWIVGIDWGTTMHELHVLDAAGETVGMRRVEHSASGLAAALDWCTTLAAGTLTHVAVGIETPHGAMVDAFLEAGAGVFSLNPKQLDRFRDRFSVAGAKDDRLDARVLASALRTDRRHFRRLRAEEPQVLAVRELTRVHEELQGEFGVLANRLREQVLRIAPVWLSLSPNADDPWFWELLRFATEDATAPGRIGQRIRGTRVQSWLTAHRIRRVSADEVLRVLREPLLPVAPGTIAAVTAHIQFLLPRLALVAQQRRECTRQLTAVIAALAAAETGDEGPPPPASSATDAPAVPRDPGDITILQSLPGVGVRVTGALIAEGSRHLRERDYASLRAFTGVAPVRRQTGKQSRGQVSMRYACNGRLRQACFHWAGTSIRFDAGARTYYTALRARGHNHARALRSVADRWLRILFAMLTTRTLYDSTRFTAASPLPTTAIPSIA